MNSVILLSYIRFCVDILLTGLLLYALYFRTAMFFNLSFKSELLRTVKSLRDEIEQYVDNARGIAESAVDGLIEPTSELSADFLFKLKETKSAIDDSASKLCLITKFLKTDPLLVRIVLSNLLMSLQQVPGRPISNVATTSMVIRFSWAAFSTALSTEIMTVRILLCVIFVTSSTSSLLLKLPVHLFVA